jgi:transposase
MVYIKTEKGQNWLFPPRIQDMIPKDHICYLIEGFVESLDYSDFDKKYAGPGNPSYHPRILLKIIIMGLLDRIRASRRLARTANENVVYIYLSEKTSPNFRTISTFRKENPTLIKTTFKEIVKFARSENLLDLSKIAPDGTKMKANASNKSIVTKEELDMIIKFIETSLKEWEKEDNIEDEKFKELEGFGKLSGASKNKIKNKIKNYIKKSKKEGEDFKAVVEEDLKEIKSTMEKNELENISLTDPDSRLMKNKKGKSELSYNPQITSDGNGFILANEVTQDGNDLNQLIPQVELVEENVGPLEKGTGVPADTGYDSAKNLKYLKDKELEGYIPNKEMSKRTKKEHKKKVDNYDYDKEKDQIILDNGTRLDFHRRVVDKNGKVTFEYKSKDKKIKKTVPEFFEERIEMKKKMQTDEAKAIYKKRGQMVEPNFGDMKENKGFLGFLTKSFETVNNEFSLVCTAVNLRKIYTKLREKAENSGKSISHVIQESIKLFQMNKNGVVS